MYSNTYLNVVPLFVGQIHFSIAIVTLSALLQTRIYVVMCDLVRAGTLEMFSMS